MISSNLEKQTLLKVGWNHSLSLCALHRCIESVSITEKWNKRFFPALLLITDVEKLTKNESRNGMTPASPRWIEAPAKCGLTVTPVSSIHNSIFAEKLITVMVDLFLKAPPSEKYSVFPDIIQTLGR